MIKQRRWASNTGMIGLFSLSLYLVRIWINISGKKTLCSEHCYFAASITFNFSSRWKLFSWHTGCNIKFRSIYHTWCYQKLFENPKTPKLFHYWPLPISKAQREFYFNIQRALKTYFTHFPLAFCSDVEAPNTRLLSLWQAHYAPRYTWIPTAEVKRQAVILWQQYW